MVAVPAGQMNDPAFWTYKEILESEGTLAPFTKKSTPREINEKLQELHKREPSQIKNLLKDRKARLQKIITYIDVETSPRDLKGKFMSDLVDDFDNHINNVILFLPTYEDKRKRVSVYIGNWEGVKTSLAKGFSALSSVLDRFDSLNMLEAVEVAGTPKIDEIINEKTGLYEALHEATKGFEQGLEEWDTGLQESDVKKEDLAKYLDDAYERLQEQVTSIEDVIYYHFRSLGSKLVLEGKLKEFEGLMRKPILETFLDIARTSLPNDAISQNDITISKIHPYFSYYSEILSNARQAKIALNLGLDKYELINKQKLRPLMRGDLIGHIEKCTVSLEEIIQTWKSWEERP